MVLGNEDSDSKIYTENQSKSNLTATFWYKPYITMKKSFGESIHAR